MPNNPESAVKPHSVSYYVLLGAALFVFIESFSLLSPILLSLLLILMISLALNPMISRMRAFTGGRKVATALVAAVLVMIIALTGWAFFLPIKASVTKISERLPEYWERLQKPLIKLDKQAVLSEEKLQAEVTTEIAQEKTAAGEHEAARRTTESAPPKTANEPGPLRSGLGSFVQGLTGSFKGMAFNAAQILIVLATVFFGVIFTLMNPRPIIGAIFRAVPEGYHERVSIILQRSAKFLPNWALATLLGMLTIGGLVFLIMWPIFGLMDALVLGLIAGILEAVPYLGPILSAIPGILFALGKGGMTPLWVVLGYLTVQALENNVILPLIMANRMKLHPVAVIFSMLLCVAAFGVLGVLIAPPMVAIVSIMHDEIYRKRFLPSVTDAELDRLARTALHEKLSGKN